MTELPINPYCLNAYCYFRDHYRPTDDYSAWLRKQGLIDRTYDINGRIKSVVFSSEEKALIFKLKWS